MIVHQVQKIWNVNAGVRLACDVQIVGLVFWELIIPSEDSLQVVLSCVVVSEVEANILLIGEIGVTDTCGLLNVEHVGLRVPAVWVFFTSPVLGSVEPLEWTVLLHEAEH